MKNKFYNLRKTRDGFTLIEMLVVIVIIGLLAVMAVSSFDVARKRVRLDVATDTITSIIKEQQGKARSGRQGSDSSSFAQTSCYGVFFQQASPFIQTVVMPYVSVPEDPTTSNADYCDAAATAPKMTELEISKDIMVQSIKQGGAPVQKLLLLFKPPFGSVLEMHDLTSATTAHTAPVQTENPLQILLNQQGNSLQDYRGFEYDVISSMIRPLTLPSTSPVTP